MIAKEKIKKLFQLGNGLAEIIKSKDDSLNATGEEQLIFRGTMFFFFCKAYKSYQAIQLLWNQGFPEDATILARTLFEIELQSRYMREDPKRVRLFLEYDPVLRYKSYLTAKELGENDYVNAIEKRTSDLSQLENQYKKIKQKYRGNNWWSGSIKELAKRLGKGMQLNYATYYQMESNMVHSNVTAINEYMRTENNKIFANCYPTESDEIYVPSIATLRIFGVISELGIALGLNFDVEIETACKEYKKLLTEN